MLKAVVWWFPSLVNRFGLCKTLVTTHVPPRNAYHFSHLRACLGRGIRGQIGDSPQKYTQRTQFDLVCMQVKSVQVRLTL